MATSIAFGPQQQPEIMDPHTETLDLVTIRLPRDKDIRYLENRDNGSPPVHIGDLFKDGAYRILHRLGNGVHSVVWLAENLRSKPRYVAIKIFSKDCDERQINTGILETLNSALQNPSCPSAVKEGLHHIVKTLDHFSVRGPIAEHACTVMELVGPRADGNVIKPTEMLQRSPGWEGKTGFEWEGESNPEAEDEEHTPEPDPNTIPRYYVLRPRDLTNLISAALKFRPPSFQLIDFTCSFGYIHGSVNPKAHIGTPYDYAPPEAFLPDLLRHLYSPASDMWSFGCILFELFYGKMLFDTYNLSNLRLPIRFYVDAARTLGKEDPIPEIFHKAILSYFPERGIGKKSQKLEVLERLTEFYEKDDWPEECRNFTYGGKMREMLAELRERKVREEEGWEQKEVDVICNVIEGCVRWDPEKRLTAKQVVKMLEEVGIVSNTSIRC